MVGMAARWVAAFVFVLIASVPASAARLNPAKILAVTERVADWQLAHLDTPIPGVAKETYEPLGWVNGALFVGLTALADRSSDPNYAQVVYQLGAREGWRLGPRLFHADDQVIAQSWIWAYEHKHYPHMIAPVKARFDAIIAAAPHGTLDFGHPAPGMEDACQKRWCWSDALFMAPPGWVELSRATGDPKYFAYADKEFWATTERLFSKTEHLYYRDTRFMTRRGPHGEKIFWSRGNGWVYAGLARILQFMPSNAPDRARYVHLFHQMSARLVELQKADGYWPVSLLGPKKGTPPETSGTGFFTFGLAYGVASGLLTDPKYRQAAERGWAALVKAVEPDGKLGWVQQIGAGPDVVSRDDTQLYGVGAFLLAGSAMFDLAHEARDVTTTEITPAGYASSTINSVSMARNNLVSRADYQFAAFYGAPEKGRVPLVVARRSLWHASSHWALVTTPFSLADEFSNTGARDDHNLVAMAIDKNGVMHLSWGMHNAPLAYAVSTTSVLGKRFGSNIAFRKAHMVGRDESAVTYPEFLQTPQGGLMFTYRDGGTGGGSGNGNQYINAYDPAHRIWRRIANPMMDGISTSMNAYFNSFAYGPRGRLFASWTIRETPDWQTNHDIFCAVSPNNGRSWLSSSGRKLGHTMNRSVIDAHAKVLSLPVHSSLINQASMAVDRHGHPVIAIWWAPGAAKGDNTRQYMLVWQDGAGAWRTSQISHRRAGETYDATSGAVRQMGRPIVLVGKGGTVLVVTRSTQAGLPVTDPSNRIVVYWSRDRVSWHSVVIATANPGTWEPTYDSALWKTRHKLSLFFQPTGLGKQRSPIQVITWDPASAFAQNKQ